MSYDNTNKGILSRNERKAKDTHPDFTGKLNVDGIDYYLDGWVKERKDGSGKFFSLSVKPIEQRAKPAGDSARTQNRHADMLAKARQQPPRQGSYADLDDEVPFSAEFR